MKRLNLTSYSLWPKSLFIYLTFLYLCQIVLHISALDEDFNLYQAEYEFENDPRLQKHIEALEYKHNQNESKRNIRKSIKLFEELSVGNDSISAQALYELGDTYFYGTPGFRGISRNPKKALDYINQSAKFGFGPALHMASYTVATGFDDIIEANEKSATRLEYFASLTNYLPSIISMGFRFLVGHGVQKSCDLALNYYKHAAETMLSSGLYYPSLPLGDYERFGDKAFEAIDQLEQYNAQKDEAMEYWEAQAKGGDPMAQYELAKLKSDDPNNSEKVAELYKQAGDQGFVPALRDLGTVYLQGDGVEANITKGLEFLKLAAEAGDPESQNFLGYLNFYGPSTSYPVEQNLTQAKIYFEQASLQDYPESLYFLGEIITDSSTQEVTEDDYRLAIRYYERSADYGYTFAFFKLAQLYDSGKGFPRSCEAAAHAYKMVTETGPWLAELRKSLTHYLKGDYVGALLISSLYAEEGYEVAQMNSVWLYKNRKGCKGKNCYKRAIRLLYLTHLQGNPKSYYEIADIYFNGRGGITKDIPLAIEFLKFGLKRGDLRVLPLLSQACEHGLGGAKTNLKLAELFLMYYMDYLNGILPNNYTNQGLLENKNLFKHSFSNFTHISLVRARLARIRLKKRFF